jgi:hypothetical protein
VADEQACCPGCGRADETTTVPAAYQESAGLPGGPGASLAPPPSGPPPEPAPRWAYAVLAGIGALFLLRLLVGVAVDGLPEGGTAYGRP